MIWRRAVGLRQPARHSCPRPSGCSHLHGAPEDASPARGSASRHGARRQRGASHTLHTVQTRRLDSRTPDTGRGHRREDTDATRRLLQAPWGPAAPRRWDGTVVQSSPLLVQWDCSPLQVLWRPGAGGARPAGSSEMQGCAQPPAGRQERGRAPGTVLLVGTRGTRKGSGRQPHRWARRRGAAFKGGVHVAAPSGEPIHVS